MKNLWNDIAYSKFKSREFDEAIIACQESLKLYPNDSYPLFLKGCINYEQQNYDLGISYLSEALKVNEEARYFHQRGQCKFELKDFEGAINDFYRAINLKENNDLAYLWIAIIKEQQLDFEGAIDDLNIAIDIKPKNYLFWQMRGDCKFELKNFIDAQEDFTEAIAGDPEEEYNFYKRACCAFELENYENAIQDLNKSIALNPDFHDFRLRGECKFKLEGLCPLCDRDELNELHECERCNMYDKLMAMYVC